MYIYIYILILIVIVIVISYSVLPYIISYHIICYYFYIADLQAT